ncbi:hypothetical protein GCK32_016079, partial [Trichostrongylus colubriformis]
MNNNALVADSINRTSTANKMSRDPLRMDLIELIELEPSIWDLTSDEYRMADRKKNAWSRVFKGMQSRGHCCTMGELRSLWRNMRDVRRKRRTTTTGMASKKDWLYDSCLSFLDKSDFHGSTVSNLNCEGEFSSVPSSSPESPPEPPAVKGTYKKGDDTIQMIRSASEAVKASAQGLVEGDKKMKDKYSSFGTWVGMQLRSLDSVTADSKMHLISTVL